MKNTLHSCLLVLPFSVLFIIPSSLTAQYFINKSWDKSFSELSDVNWSSSIMNTNGEFLTITHKVIDPSQTDLLLIKQDKNGNTIWETQFGNSNEKIYGVDLSLDPNGNIYVIGARQKSTEEYDYLIIKYNSSAIEQWHTYFDGAANGNDIPTSIIFNSFDSNVYVTGSSEGAGTNTDYSTLKVDGTLGTVLWEARYDHLNMGELPVSIEIGWSGDIIVTGGSANSTTDWDIATLQYNLLGMEQNVTRVNNNSSGFDQPTAIVKDVNDNFYITGNIIDSSTGTYDIYTAKMDLNLNIVWDTIYSGVSGLEDLAFDIKVDNQDNVYVCGTSENEDLGKDILLLKYSSSGALLWDKQRNAEQKQEMAIGRKIAITNNGQIVLTGDVSKNEDTNILTIKYDNTGKRLWEKYQHVETTGINQPFAVHIDNDDIFVSGFSKENEFATFTTNTNFKLQVYDRNAQLKYDTSGSPVHTINEILVRFNPDVVNQNFVNDQGLSFGTVDEIIDDTTLINAMDNVLGANGVIGDFKMMKIFPFLTTDKTTITSRLGRKVALPKLWSAMILKLESSAKINEFILSEALDTLPNILYAHPEFTGEVGWVNPPNDSEYTDQHSLTFHNNTSPLYPDAHINVEPAWVKIDWDNGDNNLNNIKVGIYDTGLYYEHEDFGFGGVNNYGGLEGTIVDGGWDFESTITMPFPLLSSLDNPDFNNHGTRVAGVIGALRNNNIGVAGIAGGDIENPPINETGEGVHFYGMKVADDGGVVYSSSASKGMIFALTEGVNDTPILDIMNHSWGIRESSFAFNNPSVLREASRCVFESNVISVANRGNFGGGNNLTEPHVPGTFRDDWTICVGASGDDGALVKGYNDGLNGNFFSNAGLDMDIIAPGIEPLVRTTDNANGTYAPFSGTSCATPHTVGVTALILEHYDGNLAMEDVERFIEYGATDISGIPPFNYEEGYDLNNGWGRLNAGESIQLTEDYKVLHFSIDPFIIEDYCGDPSNVLCAYIFTNEYFNYDTNISIEGLTKKYNTNVTINLCDDNGTATNATLAELVPAEKESVWKRNSSSFFWEEHDSDGGNFDIIPENNIDFTYTVSSDNCEIQLSLEGYTTDVYEEEAGINNFVETIPLVPDGEFRRFEISMLIDDPSNYYDEEIVILALPTSTYDKDSLNADFQIHPNPASDQISYIFNLNQSMDLEFHLFDVTGRNIDIVPLEKYTQGMHQGTFNLANLPNGVYFVQMKMKDNVITKKLIKL